MMLNGIKAAGTMAGDTLSYAKDIRNTYVLYRQRIRKFGLIRVEGNAGNR